MVMPVNRNMNKRVPTHAILATSIGQVPVQYRDQVKHFIERAREGYIDDMKVKGKADLRVKVLVYDDKEPEFLHGSESGLAFQRATGYFSPHRFIL